MSQPERPVFNDRYEIHSRIGRGGMADVFLAQDRLLDRPVAVKVLFPEYAADPAFVERFRREAQAAANLTHPNIVGVYDWGRQGGTYYIVMEYVAGRTLAEILRADGPLLPQRAAEITSDVAAALGFAHRNGVVHRDVKPGNILVSGTGGVKVADFGIARALNTADAGLTQTGAVMGTATYFSPEQAQGLTPDPRSDLYSLGIVMYEMVAGRPPFSGDNPVSVAYKQVHDVAPPLLSVRPDVPPAYDAIVAKLLAKDPANRYPTAEDLRADLRRFREGQPVSGPVPVAPPPPPAVPPTRAVPAAAAGVAAGAAMAATRPPVPPGPPGMPPTQAMPGGYGYPPTQTYQAEPPKRRWGWVVAVLILLALGAAAVFAFVQFNSSGDNSVANVSVPNVVNLTLEQAIKDLEAKNLVPVEIPEVNDSVAAGNVWKQDPPANTVVKEGSNIQITFNPGTGTVTLPNLVGKPQAEAETELVKLGLIPKVEVVDSDQPEGIVVEQNPKPGEVEAGSEVSLKVSQGTGKVLVPNVVNLDQVAATSQLVAAGLNVKAVQEASEDVQAGRVIRTDPGPNVEVDKGSTVTIVVSSGAQPVAVPNVVGQSESQARDTLQGAGFLQQVVFVDVANGSPQAGRVISQNPVAGTELAKGSTVTINVGRELPPPTTQPPTTTVPPTTTTTPPTTT